MWSQLDWSNASKINETLKSLAVLFSLLAVNTARQVLVQNMGVQSLQPIKSFMNLVEVHFLM